MNTLFIIAVVLFFVVKRIREVWSAKALLNAPKRILKNPYGTYHAQTKSGFWGGWRRISSSASLIHSEYESDWFLSEQEAREMIEKFEDIQKTKMKPNEIIKY